MFRHVNSTLSSSIASLIVVSVALVAGCRDNAPPPTRSAPPTEATREVRAASLVREFSVAEAGVAAFLIDAPLEKIRGKSTRFRGNLQIDPDNLGATRGRVSVDLGDLKTETFDDSSKNAKQTEHAHNWLQLGADVPPKERAENQWVHFTVRSIVSVDAAKLSDVPERDGKRTVALVAEGDVWLHGIAAPKKVELTAEFFGPPAMPTKLHLTTKRPLVVSLKEHDIKPRDVVGRFLDGALEKVGKKIDDAVQLSIELRAGTNQS